MQESRNILRDEACWSISFPVLPATSSKSFGQFLRYTFPLTCSISHTPWPLIQGACIPMSGVGQLTRAWNEDRGWYGRMSAQINTACSTTHAPNRSPKNVGWMLRSRKTMKQSGKELRKKTDCCLCCALPPLLFSRGKMHESTGMNLKTYSAVSPNCSGTRTC